MNNNDKYNRDAQLTDKTHVFKTKSSNKVVMFFGTFLATTVLLFSLFIYLSFSYGIASDIPFFVKVIVPIVIGAIVAPIATVTNKQTVITIDDETFTYTKGDKKESYLIEQFCGTHVTKNYSNGAYINSTRYLRFSQPNGNTRVLLIPFDEKEFSDMVSLLNSKNRSAIPNEVKNEIRESLEREERFDVPKDKISQSYIKSSGIRTKISILIIGISIIVCIVAYILMDFMYFIAVAIVFGLLGPLLSYVIFAYGRKETKEALAITPYYVLVDPFTISFDDRKYDASDIKRIVVSPPAYASLGNNNEFRTVILTDRSGEDHKFCFGRAPKDNRNMVYEEYLDLIHKLDAWCFANNIEFKLVLG